MVTTGLIVEDEKHLRERLRYNLKAVGFEVETAGTAEEALPLLMDDGKTFDVVVLDVMLPGMDGFSLASKLRSQGRYVPILMLTARGQAEDVLRGFEAGADDYLPKPFDLSVLLARINALLRRREWLHKDWNRAAQDGGAKVVDLGGKTIDLEALELGSGMQSRHLTLLEGDLVGY